MTFKVIVGHKSSSNFSVNLTLPLLGASLYKLCVSHSLTLSLYISLFCSVQKLIYTQRNVFRHAVSLYVTNFHVRLFGDVRPLFKLFSPFGRFYEELQYKSSLSLYLLPFTLSLFMPLPFTLSLSFLSLFSLSFYLAYLMDVFVLVHNLKYDLKVHMRPLLYVALFLKISDLLIKLQP